MRSKRLQKKKGVLGMSLNLISRMERERGTHLTPNRENRIDLIAIRFRYSSSCRKLEGLARLINRHRLVATAKTFWGVKITIFNRGGKILIALAELKLSEKIMMNQIIH